MLISTCFSHAYALLGYEVYVSKKTCVYKQAFTVFNKIVNLFKFQKTLTTVNTFLYSQTSLI